ncbi:fused MFS/spermidine synthase [Fluviibacter phosphoraccumulans]|uniref:fused MFS/spermidine synthase n=1 Tax=Fluviibacter phosphoraccumulans TaxID=1751046 RepID=UPI0024E233A3|nr:fused MFS/spermidine synthase [Fluviibacter phosphoraccumulans]
MPPLLIPVVVFIEGFCSLGAEIIALRRLVPHIGSSIVVTAPTIGFFLLALALGYAAGAKINDRYLQVVARNFLISALLLGIGFSTPFVNGLFAHIEPVWLAYTLLIGGILCPLAWLLGQTVPALTNLMQTRRTGEASGMALYWSTLGSFLGSLGLSVLVMQWLGISAAVALCALFLLIGALRLQRAPEVSTRGWQVLAVFLAATLLIIGLNVPLLRGQLLNEPQEVTETAYADYSVIPTQTADGEPVRAFKVNSSTASLISDSSPPRYARYIDYLRQTLLKDLKLKNSDILVLGAGGFTLSHREPLNRYTFVDIDPKIQTIAEQQFLHEPIRGKFIVDDARHFVTSTAKHSSDRFNAVVVDVYSSHHNIPSHLVTREFWHDTRQVLRPNGVLLANLILDSKLQSDYARNVLATIESVYGRCAIEVLHKDRPLANVEVLCQNGGASLSSKPAKHYTDEKNAADIDHARANAGR